MFDIRANGSGWSVGRSQPKGQVVFRLGGILRVPGQIERLLLFASPFVINEGYPKHIRRYPKYTGHAQSAHPGNKVYGKRVLKGNMISQNVMHEKEKQNGNEQINHNSQFGNEWLFIFFIHEVVIMQMPDLGSNLTFP